jgi:Ca2+-binding EF-hand superfamily protein
MMTMKNLAITTAVAAFLISGGLASAHPGGFSGMDIDDDGNVTRAELSSRLSERFAKLDANGDGKVKTDEVSAAHGSRDAERFARIDTDGNGSISQSEMESAHKERSGKRGGKGKRDKMRAGLDTDGDGVITKAEFDARAMKRFAVLDANGDGTVTEQERTEARGKRSKN